MVENMDEKNKRGVIKILAFAGSLRKDSYNKALVETAKELAPENVEIEVFDLAPIPLFNQDLEQEMPKAVKEFKSKIKGADAILIATPEYNRSIPGVLKNAIDWASRPSADNSFNDKPVAVFGATGGGLIGTSAAQLHMRQIFSFLNMHPVEKPQVYITGASEKIEGGRVVDEQTRELIKELVQALVQWTLRLRGNKESS
jgi:chromate reductase